MATVAQPIVGYLLSQYAETVREGLGKLEQLAAKEPGTLAEALLTSPQLTAVLRRTLARPDCTVAVLRTLCALLETEQAASSNNSDKTAATQAGVVAAQPQLQSARTYLIRELCQGDSFALLRKALCSLAEKTLPLCLATLHFLGLAARHSPRVVLARFGNKVPLQLECFRLQLSYAQRRVRAERMFFLLQLITSRYNATAAELLCNTHGLLTQLLEDAAELLQEGSERGLAAGTQTLRVLDEYFVNAHTITTAQKRATLLAQRNVIRLLVKALQLAPVAEAAATVLYRLVQEMHESPADYASTRVEAADDRGMPNYVLFFMLRHLRPSASVQAARLAGFILHTAPDLIRPYFARLSAHLADDGAVAARLAPATAQVATLNLMTRICLAPLPYHLVRLRATLQPVAAKTTTFYEMSPRDIADEVCPQWMAEYVHKLINHSSNQLWLALTMQFTYAALQRAKAVLQLVAAIRARTQATTTTTNLSKNSKAKGNDDGGVPDGMTAADVAVFDDNDDVAEEWAQFDAQVMQQLQTALPRREEFWHRMTQQLQSRMLADLQAARKHGASSPDSGTLEFLTERMLLLMRAYSDVFQLRTSWLSAAPTLLPQLQPQSGSSGSIIRTALLSGQDVLHGWSAEAVACLCSLLCASLEHGVGMVRLHHITMTSPRGGVTEWPLLLSLLLWAAEHRAQAGEPAVAETLLWVARVLQWTVHSVTARFGCGFTEALLWVQGLPIEVLPCFLHLLNHMLQRSLSKAAERVAQELFDHNQGVLLAAADTFVQKTQEKLEQTAATGGQRGEAGQAQAKTRPGSSAAPRRDLWLEDMTAHLPAFAAAVAALRGRWADRDVAAAPLLACVRRHQLAQRTQSGQRTLRLTASVVAAAEADTDGGDDDEGGSTDKAGDANVHAGHAATALLLLRPLHEQLRTFCKSLTPPVTLSGEAGQQASDEVQRVHACMADLTLPLVGDGKTQGTGHSKASSGLLETLRAVSATLPLSRWACMPALTWALASRLLRSLAAALQGSTGNDEASQQQQQQQKALYDFVMQWLSNDVVGSVEALTAALREAKEHDTGGFFVLLLCALRVCLTLRPRLRAESDAADKDDDHAEAMEAVSGLLMSTYGGTLTTLDRVRYACLLSIHYYYYDDDGSARRVLPVSKREGAVGPVVYRGAEVLQPMAAQRFCLLGHVPAPLQTAEVDVLAFLLEAWTEDELHRAALDCPARLHNTLLCNAHGVAWDLLRSVFPEITSAADMAVIALDEVSRPTLLDPRFLLPLLQHVLALPAAQLVARRYLGIRCVPLLLRALSFTEQYLRQLAATALAMAFLPNGPVRIVVGLARMKLCQLAHKQGRTGGAGTAYAKRARTEAAAARAPQDAADEGSDDGEKEEEEEGKEEDNEEEREGTADGVSCEVPRLPAPLSAFLVLALRPLGQCEHPLYNHLMRFLVAPREVFAAAVPFAAWLTSFPLGAIAVPLMRAHQDALQRHASAVVQASVSENSARLGRDAPQQLDFVLQLLAHGCATNGDAMALMRSECVQSVMLLADLVAASSALRLKFVRCLAALCATSAAVAAQLAVQGHLLLWCLAFATQLCAEYGPTRPHLYSQELFLAVLELLERLCIVVRSNSNITSSSGRAMPGRPQQSTQLLQQHVASQVEQLRALLREAHVTAKAPLDVLQRIQRLWQSARAPTHRRDAQGGAGDGNQASETRRGAGGERGRRGAATHYRASGAGRGGGRGRGGAARGRARGRGAARRGSRPRGRGLSA